MDQKLIYKDLNCSGFFGRLYDGYSFFPMNEVQEARNSLILFIHYNIFYLQEKEYTIDGGIKTRLFGQN